MGQHCGRKKVPRSKKGGANMTGGGGNTTARTEDNPGAIGEVRDSGDWYSRRGRPRGIVRKGVVKRGKFLKVYLKSRLWKGGEWRIRVWEIVTQGLGY